MFESSCLHLHLTWIIRNLILAPYKMLLIKSSRTILVPPACPLVDVLMSNDKATGRTAGVNGKLIHSKSSFYDCALHAKNNVGYFPDNYTFIRDIAL